MIIDLFAAGADGVASDAPVAVDVGELIEARQLIAGAREQSLPIFTALAVVRLSTRVPSVAEREGSFDCRPFG